ncbi:hypothetical protein BD289DRAFT_275522 [Coniella lustricola]|uniref:Zn(2)-C6 fungal-type domain-containing protein n=1 Tax=Coniella lustricola TaxID=2025994 RepID=A0A2T3A6S6_9PEZI|nr:hypothetical protein BD289DRAFT_275522 [Coniella lustricola]
MVTRTSCYPSSSMQSVDRMRYQNSRACAPYNGSYTERRCQLASHESRPFNMAESQTDESTTPRKRIAVACGRCRKRKIRCSGDPGGGQPCVNCKNAGAEQCLFLRVQSQEAPLRDDNRFDYNMDISRALVQRGTVAQMATPVAQYSQDTHMLGPGGLASSYRGSAYSGIGTKGYYQMGSEWPETYGSEDASVDYGLGYSQYQVLNSDPVHMISHYGHWSAARQQKGSSGQGSNVYLETDSAYAYGAGHSTASLAHRPASSMPTDSSAYSFSSIAASLPPTGSERLLPTPVSQTTPATSGTSSRVDGLPSAYNITKASHGLTVSGGTLGQASPVTSLSDVTAAVAVVGYAGSVYDYTATTRRSPPHQVGAAADAYAAAASDPNGVIFGDSDRNAATQGSAIDISGYGYGGASPTETSSLRRTSSASGLTSRSAVESSSGSTGYCGTDSTASTSTHNAGPYRHSSSSSHGTHQSHFHYQHQQHPSQLDQTISSHAPSRLSGHQVSQHSQAGMASVAYGEMSAGSSIAANCLGAVGSTSAVPDSHRISTASRR